MESRYFPEVNEEEEEPEDEGEGSPTCWWARPGSPRTCSPQGTSWGQLVCIFALGSCLFLGKKPCPWEAGFREIVLQQESTPQAAHACANTWGSGGSRLDQGRTVRVSCVHSPCATTWRLELPLDKVTAPHLGSFA